MADLSLSGCGTALVTPFDRDGALDEGALRSFVDWQIDQGIDFLVPCGSTGEAATMTADEHRRVVEITVEQVRGRVPVVAGAGSNDTARAIETSHMMAALGVTHLLHASPSYNKPPQRGIEAHFIAIADAVSIPVVLYNVPGRTSSNMDAATTLRLAAHPRIVAMKEASGNLAQITDCIVGKPAGFALLSGDDELTLPILALGGDGLISVVSNLAPRAVGDLVRAARAGDVATARALHHRLLPLMRAAFVESNPIPAKCALSMMGRMRPTVRLPLVALAADREPMLRQALELAGAL